MLTFVLGLLAAGQTAEADPVGCVHDKVPAAERSRIGSDALSNAENTAPSPALMAAIDTCMAQGLIAQDGKEAAVTAVVFVFAGLEAKSRLTALGIDTQVINTWYEALPEGQRVDPFTSEPAVQRLVTMLVDAGADPAKVEANGELIGGYVGALMFLFGSEAAAR